MENEKSWAEKDIEARLEATDDPDRQMLLEKAKIFKSGWVELAAALSRIAKHKEYEDWGYKTLEAYCLKELHIRKNTVAKLIGNYHFLEKKEPQLLEEKNRAMIPDIHSTNVLAKASETIDDDVAYASLKEGVLDRGFSAATAYRKMKESAPPADPEARQNALRKRVKGLVHSIRVVLVDEGDVPGEVLQALETLGRYFGE